MPKGPSTDPGQKRLAIPTEDHPTNYASFEGVIPEGQYGAGTVLVWDLGTFRTLSGKDGKPVSLEDALDRGHATVWIEGRKIRGGYTLLRIGGAGEPADIPQPDITSHQRQAGGPRWLLIKMNDAEADPGRDPVMDEPASVLSGLTIEQIAAGR